MQTGGLTTRPQAMRTLNFKLGIMRSSWRVSAGKGNDHICVFKRSPWPLCTTDWREQERKEEPVVTWQRSLVAYAHANFSSVTAPWLSAGHMDTQNKRLFLSTLGTEAQPWSMRYRQKSCVEHKGRLLGGADSGGSSPFLLFCLSSFIQPAIQTRWLEIQQPSWAKRKNVS